MTLSVEYEEDDDGYDCRTFLVVKHNGVEVIGAWGEVSPRKESR